MATYHLSCRPQQKNKYGHRVNSLSHFQYITRSGRYSDREDLVYSESGNVPDCKELSGDINRYWEAASECGRKNGRAYRDVTIALQEEFTQEENIALVHDFMHHFGIDQYQTYSMAIHDKYSTLDPVHRNIHCHLMFNERHVDKSRHFDKAEEIFKRANGPISGGLKMDRYFNSKQCVVDMREYWEKINNEKFAEKGIEKRISCKTLKAQKEELEKEGRYEEAQYLDREVMPHMDQQFRNPEVLEEIRHMANEIENDTKESIKADEESQEIVDQYEEAASYMPEEEYTQEEDGDMTPPMDMEAGDNMPPEFDVPEDENNYQAEPPDQEEYINSLEQTDMPEGMEHTLEMNEAENVEDQEMPEDLAQEMDMAPAYEEEETQNRAMAEEQFQQDEEELDGKKKLKSKIMKEQMRLYAEDIAMRRAAREIQMERAKLNTKRYQRKLYTLKQYGYDESIATGPITVTVGDVCHRMEQMANDYAEKINKYNEKAAGYRAEKITDTTAASAFKRNLLEQKLREAAEKEESRIAVNNWRTYTRYQELQKGIAALQEATTPEAKEQLRELTRKRNSLEENGRLILRININGKQETVSYRINQLERTTALDQFNPELEKHNAAREKWALEAEKKVRKFEYTESLYREKCKKLESSMPASTLLFGEEIPSRVYLTAKVGNRPLIQKPYTTIGKDVYVIVSPMKNAPYGKPIEVSCVKLGEPTIKGMARIYTMHVTVSKVPLKNGKAIPIYRGEAVRKTSNGIPLYPKYNPQLEKGETLTPVSVQGTAKGQVSGGRGGAGPRQINQIRASNMLNTFVSQAVQGQTSNFGHFWDKEKSADAKTAENAKRTDITKEMARENDQFENGEWANEMRELFSKGGAQLAREQDHSR